MQIDIEAWYAKYGPMVLRRCRSILRDEDAALDAMQEVFVQVIRFQRRLEDRAPSSLLYTMATNHCLNVLKSKKRTAPMSEPEFFDSLPARDRSEAAIDARDTVDRVFAEHDERTRLIAWLHFVDGLTLEETANTVHMSVSGIRKRLRRLVETGQVHKEALYGSTGN